MRAVLDSVSIIFHGGEIIKKALFCFFVFLFFPMAWLNHFRIIPGNPLLHWIGFAFLVCFSLVAIYLLEKSKTLNDGFKATAGEIYFGALIGNIIVYAVSWIVSGGPGFEFLGNYAIILRIILLIVYIIWTIVYWIGTSTRTLFEDEIE